MEEIILIIADIIIFFIRAIILLYAKTKTTELIADYDRLIYQFYKTERKE
jgi:hypothetical protein